jgi:hypothetical protein
LESKKDFRKLVKVAILDTGCNLKHPHLSIWLEGKLSQDRHLSPGIWGWKDFVDVDPDLNYMEDESYDGHGTFMTYLLLQTMPWLKVYIARVLDSSRTTDPKICQRVKDVSSLFPIGCYES